VTVAGSGEGGDGGDGGEATGVKLGQVSPRQVTTTQGGGAIQEIVGSVLVN
jgi:hypothetical protein